MPHVSVIVLFNVHNNVSKFDKVTSRTTGNPYSMCVRVLDQLPVVSWRRAKYKQMYGLKSTLTVSVNIEIN